MKSMNVGYLFTFLFLVVFGSVSALADQGEGDKLVFKKLPAPERLLRLSPKADVWLDRADHRVLVDGKVVLRDGLLEMFACPRNSKEHESVVAVNAKAFMVHTALLAAGAEAGGTVQWDPKYKPAHGTEIAIQIEWLDQEGKKQIADARDWVRNVKTRKSLRFPWVFGGSGFWKDDFDGKQYYLAESGDLICVSNFSSATLDLPVESSQANNGLAYEAFTDNIPPVGTPVRLILIPKLTKKPIPKPIPKMEPK